MSAGRGTPGPVLAGVGVMLVVSAFLGCVLTAAWLGYRAGPIPLPVTILAAAGWSLTLVRLAARWSDSRWFRAVPAITWAGTLIVLDAGPGGDVPVPVDLRGLGLFVAGVLVPLWGVFLRGGPERGVTRGGGIAHFQ